MLLLLVAAVADTVDVVTAVVSGRHRNMADTIVNMDKRKWKWKADGRFNRCDGEARTFSDDCCRPNGQGQLRGTADSQV